MNTYIPRVFSAALSICNRVDSDHNKHSVKISSDLSRHPRRSTKESIESKMLQNPRFKHEGAFFRGYSGLGIRGIEGINVLLGPIPFWNEQNSMQFILFTFSTAHFTHTSIFN